MRLVMVGAALGLMAAESAAQLPSAPARGDRFRTVMHATSFGSNAGPRFAHVRDRAVVMSAWQSERVLVSMNGTSISRVVEVPFAVILPRHGDQSWNCRTLETLDPCHRQNWAEFAVLGAGVSPLGLRVAREVGSVRVFASIAGGVMAFNRNMPSPRARRVNYSGDYSVGVDFPSHNGASVISLGWRFQHWSNGGTARSNPGLDANLLTLSIKERRR